MWTYQQKSGSLLDPDGKHIATGYSGAGHTAATGRNNPAMEAVVRKGPIPHGRYHIVGQPHQSSKTGPYTLDLEPAAGTETHGRSAFRIHGNNQKDDASEGCIILPRPTRVAVWESRDRELLVIA